MIIFSSTKMKQCSLFLLILSQVSCPAFTFLTTSFVHRKPILAPKHQVHCLMAKNKDAKNDDKDYEDRLSRRTNINQFLTQRTFQTFIHLLQQFRDPHTGNWIQDFLGTKNLLEFHGTGAICMERFPNWDSALKEMIDKDPDVIIVEIDTSNAGRGLSKNNPYREKENRILEIEIDIDPASLVNRMLSVRAKIASEFVQDFDLLIAANKEILSSYNQKCLDARLVEECSKKEETKTKKKNKRKKNKRNKSVKNIKKDNDNNIDKEEEEGGKEYKLSMEPLQPGSMSSGDFNFGQRTTQRFERASVYMINNHPNFISPESSLLRSTSFDLLFLLSTQESIHRLLESYKEIGEEKEISFSWLLDHYNNSLEKFFDGNQSFGRADDFLDDMLSTPPSLKKINGSIGFIDPLSIVEDIIDLREEVVEEWKLLVSLTPHDQESLKQEVFVKQMAKWGHTVQETGILNQASEKEGTEENEEEEVVKLELFGEFE